MSDRSLLKKSEIPLTENEAKHLPFRRCGHCEYTDYNIWKNGLV